MQDQPNITESTQQHAALFLYFICMYFIYTDLLLGFKFTVTHHNRISNFIKNILGGLSVTCVFLNDEQSLGVDDQRRLVVIGE